MALGVSVLLQSIERFTEPSEISDPVMVMAVGAAGIGSNVLMLLILGGECPLRCWKSAQVRSRSFARR